MSKTFIDWLPGGQVKDCRTSGNTMGTRYTARFHAAQDDDVRRIVAALATAVTEVDNQMSNWKADSDLSRVNRAGLGEWTPISANLAAVLARAVEIGHETDNAFNIGVGDLVDAWGFGPAGKWHPPVSTARPCPPIDALLEIDLPKCQVRKHGAIALDLCGIAKGFGVDELARVLNRHGIGAWLVGIDGEMRARGCKHDGSPWAIALESPKEDRRKAMGVIELTDAAIATSGDYRHWAWFEGHRVTHTMDPRSGAPLRKALASVTVISESCMDADAYATALMVLGEAAGGEHARRLGLDAFFVAREEGRLRATGTGVFADA